MMRVHVTAEQLNYRVPGGIATYIRGLRKGLSELNDTHVEAQFVAPHISVPVLNWAWNHNLMKVGKFADVVHISSMRIPPIRSNNCTVMVHDLLWRSLPEAFGEHAREWHDQMLDRAKKIATRFVVPSEATRDALVRCGVELEIIDVIAEGADHLPPSNLERTNELLKEKNVDGEIILSVCTLEPRKNLERVISGYLKARSSLSKRSTLLVVGPSGWGNINSAESNNVKFLGAVDPSVLAGLYSRASAFVYTPLAEGYGLPPLEAMWHGVATIASPVPSLSQSYLKVDPLDETSISNAMVQVINDDAIRARLEVDGKEYAQTKSWKQAAQSHLKVWEKVVKSNG